MNIPEYSQLAGAAPLIVYIGRCGMRGSTDVFGKLPHMSVFRSASLSLILPLLLISCGDVDRVDRSEIDAPDIVTRVDVDVTMGALRRFS
jgi:hypothetical protein